ncbi:hypothetical protein [Paraburkholderia strydomiana]|uniref:hypothetical protein n=1 Tax=Paraburkholderia strydomiana TaxID=1245417 RepID=UPI001BECD264|nr:hypothetical protein [Paraburkholderia strydomiana]MBT2793407.1 hypothetical protein [Paraburkholderia strydomiana]
MTTVSAQTRAAQAGASTETSAANRADHDASHTQAVRFSAVYKNNVTFAHAHHSHHLAQANSAKARQLAAALRKRQAAARAAGKRFAPSQRAASTAHGASRGAHATGAKTALRKVQADRVTRDGGRQGGGGGGGQPQQESGQQNGKQRDNPHDHDHDSASGDVFAATAVGGVSAVTPPRSSAARGAEIRAAIGEALLKLRDGIAAGNVPSADRALQSLMQRIHMLRAAEGALAPSTSAARRELLTTVSQRLAQTALDATGAAGSTQQLDARGAPSAHGSTAGLAQRVNLLANLVLLVLERPNTPDQAERARHLNAALLGAIEARLHAASRA